MYKNLSALKRDETTSAFEQGPVEVIHEVEESNAEEDFSSPQVTVTPEALEREAAIDAYMRGEEEPFLRMMEKEALMEATSGDPKTDEEVIEKREVEVRHGHVHVHQQIHRSANVEM